MYDRQLTAFIVSVEHVHCSHKQSTHCTFLTEWTKGIFRWYQINLYQVWHFHIISPVCGPLIEVKIDDQSPVTHILQTFNQNILDEVLVSLEQESALVIGQQSRDMSRDMSRDRSTCSLTWSCIMSCITLIYIQQSLPATKSHLLDESCAWDPLLHPQPPPIFRISWSLKCILLYRSSELSLTRFTLEVVDWDTELKHPHICTEDAKPWQIPALECHDCHLKLFKSVCSAEGIKSFSAARLCNDATDYFIVIIFPCSKIIVASLDW